MRILWITSRLLPDACRAIGCHEQVVGGWMQSLLSALIRRFGNVHQYFILSSDCRHCDVQIGCVHHRSFGDGKVTYGKCVPSKVEAEANRAISEFRPDIIHIHGTEFFYGRMRKGTYRGVPTVVSLQGIIHGCQAHFNGEISKEELWVHQFNLRRFLLGRSIFGEQKQWRKKRVPQESLVFKTHNNFVGRTDWDRAWTNMLNPQARYYHVNEIMRDEFYSGIHRSRDVVRPHSIYCSAATAYPLKGAHVILRAVAMVKDKYPDIQVRFCSATRLTEESNLVSAIKAEQYNSYLRHIIKDLGISNNVIGLGKLNAAEVAVELSRAEVFVLPSFCENSPNSLGEAQLIGTPVVATHVGGVPSVLCCGEEGLLVPSGDPASLAAKIDWMFSHPEKADAFAENAKAAAIVRYNAESNAEAMMETYTKICAG